MSVVGIKLRVGDFLTYNGSLFEVQMMRLDGDRIYTKVIDPVTGAHTTDFNLNATAANVATPEQITTALRNRMNEVNAKIISLGATAKMLNRRIELVQSGKDPSVELLSIVRATLKTTASAGEKLKNLELALGKNISINFED